MTRNPDSCSHLDSAPQPHLLSSLSAMPGPTGVSASQVCCASVAERGQLAGAATWPALPWQRAVWPAWYIGVAWALLLLLLSLIGPRPARGAGRPDAAGRPGERMKSVLDLSKKETFLLLAVNGDPQQVRITDVQVRNLPTKHRLIPAAGPLQLGQPLDIQLEDPDNVRIRLALVKRGHDLALRISPQVVLSETQTVELTQDRVVRAARSFARRVKDLNQQIASLAQQRQTLNVWLISPGNKSLDAVKTARFRVKVLGEAIRARQRDIPVAQSQCAALQRAGEFVKKLHNHVEIQFVVQVANVVDATADGSTVRPP